MVCLIETGIDRDLKVLARFIEVYCKGRHADADREPVSLKTHNVARLLGRTPQLCAECRKLLAHAFVKRANCPMIPKPSCKNCPSHCYHPTYRAAIKGVMRYSGPRLIMGGRLSYLFHLLF